jgi:hypothetical protein
MRRRAIPRARRYGNSPSKAHLEMAASASAQRDGSQMSKQIATLLYWVGVLISLPFFLLVAASVMRMFSEGLEAKYVNSAFLGVAGAAFSYSVGYLLSHMLTRED